MRSNSRRGLLLLALPCLLLGCVGPGMLSDGSSVAMGNFNNGALRRGRKLPDEGPGFMVPTLWRERGAARQRPALETAGARRSMEGYQISDAVCGQMPKFELGTRRRNGWQ